MTISLELSRLSTRWRDLSITLPDWAWLMLIAAPLRFINLGAEPLWYDELFQIWWAKMPLTEMFVAIRGDVHPPGWYLIEWVTIRLFGDSEFAVRLPAALFGLLAIWLTWRLALALNMSRSTAFLAGLLAAVMPALLYYSQDARMYPMLTCAVLLAALAAVEGSWPVFTVASIVAVYTQNLGWFYVATIGITAACMRPRRWSNGWRGPILSAITIGLAYAPWLPSLIHQVNLVRGGYWIQPLTLGAFLFPYAQMIMGWRMAEPLQAHLYATALAMTAIALIVSRRSLFTNGGRIMLAVAFGAPLLIAAISVLWRSVYLDRAMLPATVALMPMWAYALTHLSIPNRRVALAILAPMLGIGVVAHYFPISPRNDLTPAQDILSQWQPGDVLYLLQTDGLAMTHYYLPDKPYAAMPEAASLGQSLSAETRAAMHLNEATIDQVAAQGYKRAWLIYAEEPMISQAELDYAVYINKYPIAATKYYGADPYARVYVDLVMLK